MSAHSPTPPAELLDDGSAALTLDEGEGDRSAWRFSGATVVRARRIAHLELTFDADPHLAALTADLIEEVTNLRQQLRHLKGR
jgi:chaperone modulatory protein CbpM